MEWSDIKDIVAKGAPLVGGLIGGPAGAAVGGIVAAALGVEATPDAVSAALQNNPDALVKVKQIEADHSTQLAQIAMQVEQNRLASETTQFQAAASDRADARKNATESKDNTARYLAYIYTLGFFVTLYSHIWMLVNGVHIDPTSSTLINVLEGILTAMVLGSKEYFFGSSSGDVKKSADLAQIAKS